MNLFEIDQKLYDLIDPETGEIVDIEAYESLSMSKQQKMENLLLYIKNLKYMIEDFKEEIQNLNDRKKAAENKCNRLMDYVKIFLEGNKFSTARVEASFRKSNSVYIEDDSEFVKWAVENNMTQYLLYSDPKPSKTAIKEALSRGEDLHGCSISSNTSLTIK